MKDKYTFYIEREHRGALRRMYEATGFSVSVLIAQALDEFLVRTGALAKPVGTEYAKQRDLMKEDDHATE